MNKLLFVLNFLQILFYTYAYPLSIGPNKFSSGGGNYNNICYLNYNNAYTSFYEWSRKNSLT